MGREGTDCPSINKQTALKGDMVVLSFPLARLSDFSRPSNLQVKKVRGLTEAYGGGVLISFRGIAPKDTKHSIAHLSFFFALAANCRIGDGSHGTLG